MTGRTDTAAKIDQDRPAPIVWRPTYRAAADQAHGGILAPRGGGFGPGLALCPIRSGIRPG